MLEVKNACVSYGKSRVVNGISLKIEKPQTYLILGRNGVGKTTFMKSIIGLLPMDSGSIRIDNTDITKCKAYERSQKGIAYVPQGREIIPMLTVKENLQLGCVAHKKVDFESKMEEVLSYLPDLTIHLKRRGGVLSGGQQQQLAIARALMSDPQILILDEPTEGIQPNIVMGIADILKRYQKAKNITLIIVEQNLHFARRIGDNFMIIQKGLCVKDGNIDQLTDEISAKYISV